MTTLRDAILANPACSAAVTARDCQAIAEIMSVGRVRYRTTMITERGIRSAVPVPAASQFIRLLKEVQEADTVPTWLVSVLAGAGIPAEQHVDYFDAIASAYGWLRQDAGLDLGSAAARGMLDLIAMSDPARFGGTATALKALAQCPDPVTAADVADALFNPDGTLK